MKKNPSVGAIDRAHRRFIARLGNQPLLNYFVKNNHRPVSVAGLFYYIP